MKKFLPLLLMLGMGSSAYAGGIVSSHTSSVQLPVDAARTDASRKVIRETSRRTGRIF